MHFLIFRFLHIGPTLTSFLFSHDVHNTSDVTNNDTNSCDPLKLLPISDNDTTVIWCSNAIQNHNSVHAVALNNIILRYGFQVEILKLSQGRGHANYHFSNNGLYHTAAYLT